MTPTNFYYLGLYLLVIVIRFFKLYKVYSNKKSNDEKFKWKPVFYVSLEIVYTSAGFIIVLLENSKEWIAAIVIFYIILVLISSNIDSMDEKFSEKAKFITHLTLIILIMGATFYSFSSFLKNANQINTKDEISERIHTYKVAVPYTDNTLTQHIGFSKFSSKKLFVSYEVKCKSIKQVVDTVKIMFYNDSTINPAFGKNSFKRLEMMIDENNLIIQKLD